ncbi:NUDIX hydrolase [Vulgatibacter sp.]|uniref:NUDIX hydrolase n=1 Tax=Vulgatibacter sp. TaxID=1971226 RepID=UPI003561F041
MTADAFLEAVRHAVEGRAVGGLADAGADPERQLRPASVLIPLYEERGEPGVVLLRRSDHLGKHPGQIAFPGGGRDGCEDELACALRESQEEVGLRPEQVEILGRLDRYATITGYLVSPFIGRLRRWPLDLVPDPSEVAAILHVPIARLIEPGALRVSTFGGTRTVNFFEWGGEHVIWGATARMLRQLLELALDRPLEPSGEVPWEKVRW